MSESRPNPLGVEQFEFVEFAAPDASLLHTLFKQLGFSAVGKHKSLPVTLYAQGGMNFLVNETPDSFASEFAAAHGPCCTGFALRVSDPEAAHASVLAKGAKDFDNRADTLPLDVPRIEGIGGSVLYLTGGEHDLDRHFDIDPSQERHPRGFGMYFIDHLTHNVYNGNMRQWADFYTQLFGFYERKYFDIRGKATGLRSQAMMGPNARIAIPVNESEDPKSQINEYLNEYKGEGVQHIALYTDNIYETMDALAEAGVDFLSAPPSTYYDMIDERIPNHGEDVEGMRRRGILIDADADQPNLQLLQIFTQTNIGPIFFEIIQRKGNDGFGDGNFKALFEAIERDQEIRGVL